MAPHAIEDFTIDQAERYDLKAKVVGKNVEVEVHAPPPVADDFMYDFKYNAPLPTSDMLGIKIPSDCDAGKEAQSIIARLSEALGTGNAGALADLFIESGKFDRFSE